jgi:hypothetical protein
MVSWKYEKLDNQWIEMMYDYWLDLLKEPVYGQLFSDIPEHVKNKWESIDKICVNY